MRKPSQVLILLVIFGAIPAGDHAENATMDEVRVVADAALLAGEWGYAERSYRTLLDWSDTGEGADHELVHCLSGLATAMLLQDEVGEARALFARSLRILRHLEVPDPRATARALHGLARATRNDGSIDGARSLLHQERMLRERWARDEPLELARTLRELDRLDGTRRSPASPVSWVGREFALYEQARGLGQLEVPSFLEQVARDAERGDRALQLHLLRAAALSNETWPDDAALADAMRGVARVYRNEGLVDEALAWFERAWRIRPPTRFVRAFDAYGVFPRWKAFAVSIDADGHWSSGFFTGERSEEQAVEAALEQCRRRLAWYRVNADCRVYALNDTIVWEPASAAVAG